MKQNKSIRLSLLVVAVAVALVDSGCASTKPDRSRTVPGKAPAYPPDSHLVFDPGASSVPFTDVARAEWPSVAARGARGEVIEYSERLTDRQGQFGHDRDYLVRRFHSVRSGRMER